MHTPTATIRITDDVGATISPLIFGGMIEHFGRTVEPGIWDSKRDIPRSDAKAAIEAMGVRALRYPGGCFSDTYHWKDGVGPRDKRPLIKETFWTTMTKRLGGFGTSSSFAKTPEDIGAMIGPAEPNLLGTDEFLRYCLDINAEPFLVVNLGTGTAEEAAEWVQYCNVDRKSPRPVTWWSIGNETWGKHEFAHSAPDVYGRRVVDYAKAMRAVDPNIKLVAVGLPMHDSGGVLFEEGGGLATYTARDWNTGVLKEAGQYIDLLSVHWYFPGMIERPLKSLDDLRQLCSAPQLLDEILASTTKFVDEMVPNRRIDLSFDEWNRMVVFDDHLYCNHALGNAAFFAGSYNAMLANAERVPMAILSHLVNCLAPIQTDNDRFFVTVSYLVAKLYACHARGRVLKVQVDSPTFHVPGLDGLAPEVWCGPMAKNPRKAKIISAQAVRDGDKTAVFIVISDPAAEHQVQVDGWSDRTVRLQWVTGSAGVEDVWAENDMDHPDNLRITAEIVKVDGLLTVTVPRAGFMVISD